MSQLSCTLPSRQLRPLSGAAARSPAPFRPVLRADRAAHYRPAAQQRDGESQQHQLAGMAAQVLLAAALLAPDAFADTYEVSVW